ncbi:MAG: maleylacetoacetate isomerase [Bdellovibrionales bacterium]|nr:maleylacetoacetate isomerase [Bdellovibrionales bacterium]
MPDSYRLYHYWRSSSSWRIRFALDFKGIPYEPVAVSLLNGESESPDHMARNPASQVPVLEIPGNPPIHLSESLAILHYLEEAHPDSPSLLPGSPLNRARIRMLAELINSGIQPFHNPPVLERHSSDLEAQKAWARDFILRGLRAFETLCSKTHGLYSVGDEPSIADACLIPQIYSAERFQVDWSGFPSIRAIVENLRTLPAHASSHADRFKPVDYKG